MKVLELKSESIENGGMGQTHATYAKVSSLEEGALVPIGSKVVSDDTPEHDWLLATQEELS